MKVELRKFLTKLGPPEEYRKFLICIPDPEESKLIDEVFGDRVGDDGFISKVVGSVKLSDGYAEHYISLEPIK